MKNKILTYFIYMISIAILLTMILLIVLTYRLFERRVFENLKVDARMLSYMIVEDGCAQVENVLGNALRITWIAADGTVMYDSSADVSRMENHASRPEIAAAFESGEGMIVRESHTVQTSTYYYALRLQEGSVLRVAEEASSIWSIYLRATPLILTIALLMFGVCFGGANLLTSRLLRPIKQMTARLGEENAAVQYPELEPFMSMIRKQHEEILRSADMRVQFTANVSHELKTPLTSISGYAELIESGMAKEKQAQHFAGEIRKSANRLLTLINDIIRLSQMDSPSTNLNVESVDLGQIAADTIEQMKIGAQKMNVTLQLDARTAEIEADRRMMEELLYNLCDNAIRYNVYGGSVRVEVRPLREQVMICVQDTGIGISKENQERVFERFYRVDKSRSKATGGTGLGLAIVKHIAAKHGASILLESEPGYGTAITVIFDRMMKNMEGERHVDV